MKVLFGNTPDTSPFRFKFWQPVKFSDNPAKFPNSQWIHGRFLGIAWDSGDVFTFQVWSTLDGNWRHGTNYVCNVVRLCKAPLIRPDNPSKKKNFTFQRKVQTKKRRSNGSQIFCLVNVPEEEISTATTKDKRGDNESNTDNRSETTTVGVLTTQEQLPTSTTDL